jgi:dienelactone hydrolase
MRHRVERRSLRSLFLLALLAAMPVAVHADAGGAIFAFPSSGPYAVGCSNVEQDFARVPAGDSAEDYWEGLPKDGQPRYLTDLLVDPTDAIVFPLTIPDDGELFGRYANASFLSAALVCYPTTATNPRPDYRLPTGDAVPHMQRGGAGPIFADPQALYPLLLFSTGLTGSPISGDYIDVLHLFASWGYIVVAPFPGDSRFADVRLENFRDAAYALLHIKDFVAMQAVRPLGLSRALDAVLADPRYAGHVDPTRVGGFGASLGGESLLLMAGAQLTTTLGQSSRAVMLDPRLGAAVGYVPYFGQDALPSFGRDQKGLSAVTLPYLALAGTADTTAPIGPTRDGVRTLRGTRQLVALSGVEHGFAPAFADDIFTWSLAFLAGQLGGEPAARARSARMTAVAGGGDDTEEQDYMAPSPALADERIVVEYRAAAPERYFLTAAPAEAALLDAGVAVPGWTRTGFAFKARPAGDPHGNRACRFFGTPGRGPNSHFFTAAAAECAAVAANPAWTYEGVAFAVDVPPGGDCAADRIPVVRLYDNGIGGQASHRWTTSRSEMRALADAGWLVEGTVFCALP